MAEGAFRAAARSRGIAAITDSAGIGDWHVGDAPDPRARDVAARNGAAIDDLRARQVTARDFTRFDHIIAMDSQNLADLRAMAPTDARARLSLMLDHVPGRSGQSVADPYYGGAEGFRATWADVSAGANGLLDRLHAGK